MAIFPAILALLISCNSGSKDPWTYVTLPAGTGFFKLNQSSASLALVADSANARQLPIRPYDVFFFSDDHHRRVFRHRNKMPDTLYFGGQDSLITLNGKCYGVNVTEGVDVQWLTQKLTESDIRNLKHLYIEGKLEDRQLPLLEAIAAVNPGIDLELYVGDDSLDSNRMAWIGKRFKPAFMILDCDAKDIGLLADFPSLENLVLFLESDEKTLPIQSLPHLPKLQALTVSFNIDGEPPPGFFALNPQIRSLDLNAKKMDIAQLAAQTPQLQQVYIRTETKIQQLPYGRYWPSLRTLYLHAPLDSLFNFHAFSEEPDLLELGIGQEIDQRQFDSLVLGQPRLRWLEIQQEDTLLIKDYHVLSSLDHLRYLLISAMIGEVDPLEKLKKLEFLSIPILNAADSAKWKRLETALPRTRITPNTGYCMGSGWILMTWPVVILTLVVLQHRRRKQKPHEI